MRFAAYAGTSMVLASGVIIRALHERANFYSACVYLAQSNACLMILTNNALLAVCIGMLGLQRTFYGTLRPIEVEQLYEKAWFAITETCLAMTIFREEVGGWFLVMFVCLLIGKVWGWIGEGRVEILEQQPPSNPRLFHARLSVSLMISTLFDMFMLRYSINTVLRHARPNMMVMFAFEFAVLTIASLSSAARYIVSLYEARIIKNQIQNRRAQMRRERRIALSQLGAERSTGSASNQDDTNLVDDIDSLDIDVPGWEEKGRWVFYLDLTTDFCKLILYLAFFCVLCMFYGMPIHIIRDVALTIRSFYKRITDFVRYRQATRDMNARYPDATPEQVAREDVCIICRENMRPWQQQDPGQNQERTNAAPDGEITAAVVDERLRPKKLPCGHILHFACLRSWLERQQNCPTCRRPVLVTGNVPRVQEIRPAIEQGRGPDPPEHPQARLPFPANAQQPMAGQNVFNIGPLRIAFGARQVAPDVQQPQDQGPHPLQPEPTTTVGHLPHTTSGHEALRQIPGQQNSIQPNVVETGTQLQLFQIEQQLVREIYGLRIQQDQLHRVRALQTELMRLRMAQVNPEALASERPPALNTQRLLGAASQLTHTGPGFVSGAGEQSLGTSHPSLPTGLTIPPGWTVLPLHRLPEDANTSHIESDSDQSLVNLPTASTDIIDAQTSPATNAVILSETPSVTGHRQSSSAHADGLSPTTDGRSAGTSSRNGNDVTESKDTATQERNGILTSEGSFTQNPIPIWGSRSQPSGLSQLDGRSTATPQSVNPGTDDVIEGGEDGTIHSITRRDHMKDKRKAPTVEEIADDDDDR